MSTEIFPPEGEESTSEKPLAVTSFFGGVNKGTMLQFTPIRGEWAELTLTEVRELSKVLAQWLKERE
jgi:hypothetical protein